MRKLKIRRFDPGQHLWEGKRYEEFPFEAAPGPTRLFVLRGGSIQDGKRLATYLRDHGVRSASVILLEQDQRFELWEEQADA